MYLTYVMKQVMQKTKSKLLLNIWRRKQLNLILSDLLVKELRQRTNWPVRKIASLTARLPRKHPPKLPDPQ
jgi:hypothetical protein